MTTDQLHKFMLERPAHNPTVQIYNQGDWIDCSNPTLNCYRVNEVRWKPSPKKEEYVPEGVFVVAMDGVIYFPFLIDSRKNLVGVDAFTWTLKRLVEVGALWSRDGMPGTWKPFEREVEE